MEPYLLWNSKDAKILYDERFFDYGFNKNSYFETLRYSGYNFSVISGVFGFDLPHVQ